MEGKIVKMLKEGYSYLDIANEVGCSTNNVWYHAKKHGLLRGKSKPKFNWIEIRQYYDEGHSLRECQDKFDFSSGAWDNAVKNGKLYPRRPKEIKEYLTEKCNSSRNGIKKRLLKEGLLKEICSVCSLVDSWCGKKLVLILDHINGVNDDYRLENLRLLCPNCNSQTNTFAGRNKKNIPG